MPDRAKLASVGLVVAALVVAVAGVAGQSGAARTVAAGTSSGEASAAIKTTQSPTPAATRTPEPTAVKPFLKKAPAAKPRVAELPKSITIPSIEVSAGFEYVGLAPDGAMDVPKDPSKVAWYQLGPRPGEQGNAVVAGHVDWGGKLAVFWGLRNLVPGDSIEVVAMDDRRYEFLVQWTKLYPASGGAAADEVFSQSDETELTLITCGGEFDSRSRQYLSRVVVRAATR